MARGREWARSGAVGKVQTVEWEVHRTSGGGGGLTAWRQEEGQGLGGILIDHGWHAFYLLMAWAGEVPKALKARLSFAADQTGVDQEAKVRLRFPSRQGRVSYHRLMAFWSLSFLFGFLRQPAKAAR